MPLKAIKATREIIEYEEQSKYDQDDLSDNFKGKIVIMNPEESEIAKNVKIAKKGTFAVKV